MKEFVTRETCMEKDARSTERKRLAQRLADLQDRLEAMRGTPEDGADLECWTAGSELAYAVPEELRSVREVLRAMGQVRAALEDLDHGLALRRTARSQVEGQLSLLGNEGAEERAADTEEAA